MKPIETKKLLIITIPILLVILVAFVFLNQQDQTHPTTNQTDKPFIPEAVDKEDSLSKIESYTLELETRKKEEYESNVVYSDVEFFTNDIPTPNQNLSAQEIYANTVIAPSPEVKKSTPTTTKPRTTSKTPVKTTQPTQQEKSSVTERYNQAIATPTTTTPSQTTSASEDATPGARKRSSTAQSSTQRNLINACIHGDQEVASGTTVRMRLLDDLKIGNMTIPKNTIFYGIAQIGSDRLSIRVSSLKYENYIAQVQFIVYDNDAIEGLNLPDNIKNEILKQSSSNTISSVSLPQSTGVISDVVNTTANVIKGVTSSSIKEIKVNLKSNYKIYIK